MKSAAAGHGYGERSLHKTRHHKPCYNANGAGISADPTLTSAWTLCTLRDFWRTVRLAGFRAYLAPDVWPRSPGLATGVSGFRHRRSHRHPAFTPALLRSAKARRLRVSLPCAVAWPRPCSFADPDHRGLGAFAFPPLSFSARFPACPTKPRRALLKRARLHLAKAYCMQSLDERVDMFPRHPRDINHQKFKALRLFIPADLCPEDNLKLRLGRRSGNILKGKFSTFPRIPCGHGWISQRLVAFAIQRATSGAQSHLQTVISPLINHPDQGATRFFRRFRRLDCAGKANAAADRST